ncbi:MAG: sulfotransferase [Planctomycetota bacterium]
MPIHLKVQREGGWMLYCWHGMRLRAWLGLLRRGRFRVTPNCLPMIVTVTLVSLLNSLLYRLSELIYRRRAEATEFTEPPIFVIGHWRSGTTLLHELLTCDPVNGYCDVHQALFPNQFIMTDRFVGRWFNIFLPKRRPMDRMRISVNKPQEDEFALCNLGLPSPYLTMAFPRQGPSCAEYLTLHDIDASDRQRWCDRFLWYMKRLAYQEQRRGKRRLVLKSPTHTARIRTLLELFPDAKFIYIARNPYEVFGSTMRLWKSMNSVQGLQNPAHDDAWLRDDVLDTFARMDAAYQADRGLIPEGNLVELRFEQVTRDPRQALLDLYQQFGIKVSDALQANLDGYVTATSDHIRNQLQMAPDDIAAIRQQWGGYIERFGYTDAPLQTSPSV